MGTEIEAYQLAWHPVQGCQVRLKFKGQMNWVDQKVGAMDLVALAAILKESPAFATNGWVHTGPELVGQ